MLRFNKEGTEGSTQQASSLTQGQAGGSVQQDKSSPRQSGAGSKLEQDGSLWEQVGQQAADVAAAWSQKRRNSGSTVDQQVQENRRRIIPGSASIGSRSSIDTTAASVTDESRATKESKYDATLRTKLDFSERGMISKEEHYEQMQSMYERLLAQKPAAANYGSSESNKKRTGLPKVEYNKLVNLSLTNFDEYKISIYNLGYSRKWPECFSQPSAKDLTIEWDGSDNEDGDVRREAFLVLYNTSGIEVLGQTSKKW